MRRTAFCFALLLPFASLAQQAPFARAVELGRAVLSASLGADPCTPPPKSELRQELAAVLATIHEAGLSEVAGLTPVDFAVMSDDPDALRHVLALGYPLATRDGNPLHVAAQLSSPAMIRLLVELGVDPNGRTQRGATPLMVAAGANRLAAVRELLSLGARADAREDDGTTVLVHAMVCHDQATVDVLLQSGAKIDERARRLAGRHHVRLQ